MMMYSQSIYGQAASSSSSNLPKADEGRSSSSFGYSYDVNPGPGPGPSPFSPGSTSKSSYYYNNINNNNRESDSMLYYKDKPVKKKKKSQAARFVVQKIVNEPWNIVGVLLVLGAVWGCSQRANRAWLLREFRAQSLNQAVAVWHDLQDDHSELVEEYESLFHAQGKWEERDTAWRQHVQRLHNFTQRESRRAVLDKFGAGPHYVSVNVILPNDSPSPIVLNPDTKILEFPQYNPKDIKSFQVELAPLSEMPHAVHLFLEQVSHGLWNKVGSSFYINQDHVLQAGPRTREARQHFMDYSLDKMAFPEYSHAFPHNQWTVGFAGRPGGPSFYINKIDNSEDHGPYGQGHHALHEFADSCFAKIVSGFDTLGEIIKQTDSQHHTMIVGMEIVEWKDHWTDENDAHWRNAHVAYNEADDSLEEEDDFHAAKASSQSTETHVTPDNILLQEPPQHFEPARNHHNDNNNNNVVSKPTTGRALHHHDSDSRHEVHYRRANEHNTVHA